MISFKIEEVTAVLLADGLWHEITCGTLYVEEYQWTLGGHPRCSDDRRPGETDGFRADLATGGALNGPLSSVLAVRTSIPPTPTPTTSSKRG